MVLSFEKLGKPLIDTLAASVGLLVTAPVLAAVAAAVVLESGRPALFVQERVGQNGVPFNLLKFRSMAVGTPSVQSVEATELKVTGVGRFIRRTNLDELPQLVNILRGDMSLVGPRPALASQTELLELRATGQATSIKPGLTGLAQVNSFDGMTHEKKAEFDNCYARKITLIDDMRILAQTVRYVLNPPPVY